MGEEFEYETVEYAWMDDLYQMNQNEGDDYRHENDDPDPEAEECEDCGETLEECTCEYEYEPREDFGHFGEMGLWD